jgi:hypothetical protein
MRARRARWAVVAIGMAVAALFGACAPAGGYKIALKNPDGTAVRWNPCQQIRYVVNLAGAPSFTLSETSRAVAELESASGLDFVYAGTTTERPGGRPARNGTGWSPVLISFATATEVPFSSPNASGWGQPVAVVADTTTGRQQYVTGQVVLRPGGWTQGTSSSNPLSLMLQHELGHVVGLGHATAAGQIMGTAGNGSVRQWGEGDLVGLEQVGRPAGCLPVVP